MSDQQTQPGVRVNESLWKEFRQDVLARKGSVRGHLKSELETALREYINASDGGDTHDRLRRMENKLETIEAHISDEDKNKKESSVGSETKNKLQRIRQEIDRETDGSPKVHNEVVELAIREHAGGSDPTIRRYKRLLQQDRDLFEHPVNKSVYFRSAEDYTLAVNSMAKGGRIDQDVYDEILESYGREWWIDQLPDEETDGGSPNRGFQ